MSRIQSAGYVGDFLLGTTFDFKFNTFDVTGAPITLAGSPTITAYVDNSVTESTSGLTLSVDFDSRTGMHNVRVVATGGNGFASGSSYQVVLSAGTVDSVSVTYRQVGHFTIDRCALKPATAGRTLVVDASGLADATVVKLGPSGSGTAQTARDIGASVLLSAGTGTGQLDFTSGVVKANLAQILGTALTETAGLLAGGFKKFFNVSSPTGTLNSIPDAVAGAAGGLFIAGSNAATTANITGNLTGNVTGSVGSVTGAVGSVTGAVGSVAAGGITSSSFAANAIDASAIAANAIGASELAADVITDIWQGTALTEAYAADGAAATPAQLLYMIWSFLAEKNVSSTTLTAKKLDGSTTAMTFTLDSAATPTSITRAT